MALKEQPGQHVDNKLPQHSLKLSDHTIALCSVMYVHPSCRIVSAGFKATLGGGGGRGHPDRLMPRGPDPTAC